MTIAVDYIRSQMTIQLTIYIEKWIYTMTGTIDYT